jgi:hypothetical protein
VQTQDTPEPTVGARGCQTNRGRVVELVHGSDVAVAKGGSVRTFAEAEGVAPSTMYHWRARRAATDASPAEAAFFESPEGLGVLHRIQTAAHLVFGQAGGCGCDRMGQFLSASRLDRFVAASHGAQHEVAAQMESLLVEYGEAERTKLAPSMAPKLICLAADETFHPETCLVAMDPASGMILVERYSERRDEATWTTAIGEALADLPVTVVQLVSDEARGLVACACQGLGVHHGSDLFHVQYELAKATSRALRVRLEAPRLALEQAEADTARAHERKADYWDNPRPPGRPPLFDRYTAEAEAAQQVAQTALDVVIKDRADARQAVRDLSSAYHPFDLATGESRSAEAVTKLFQQAFATLDTVADRANLAQRARQRIDKARRVVPKLVASVAFFHRQLDCALTSLQLGPDVLEVVRTQLVPGLYLTQAARRTRTAAERLVIQTTANTLLASARAATSPLARLDTATSQRVEELALAYIELFVRSSACVEGRNGQLALHHHGLHRLSKRRLAALTVLHNYYILRPDGTTAAERFFGQPPDDLVEWLLARLDLPARPRRSHPMKAA